MTNQELYFMAHELALDALAAANMEWHEYAKAAKQAAQAYHDAREQASLEALGAAAVASAGAHQARRTCFAAEAAGELGFRTFRRLWATTARSLPLRKLLTLHV